MIPRKLLLPAALIFGFSIYGCGSDGSAMHDNTKMANSNANKAIAVPSPDVNPPSNASVPPAAPAVNTASSAGTQNPKKIPVPDLKPQPINQTAPDGSQISVALGADLVKTRTFKNNSQLTKVEEILVGATPGGKKTIKVYLKNGQVKEISEGKVGDAMTESAAGLLKAIDK